MNNTPSRISVSCQNLIAVDAATANTLILKDTRNY